MVDQGQRRLALCKIVVDGEDVTSAIDPHLISVQTVTRSGDKNGGDQASIELDDRDGRLAIPPPDAPIEISLGWSNETLGIVWKGVVKDIESGFSRRGGGRRLWLECQSWTPFGVGHDRVSQSWGEGERPASPTIQFEDWDKPASEITLEEVLQQAGQAAGLTVKLSPSMRTISRKYWAQQNESFLNFGSRLARELGGNFKVVGDVATLVHATDGLNVDGEEMGTIDAEWGVNLISWRIKPFSAEPQAKRAASVVFDRGRGAFDLFDKAIGGGLPFGLSRATASLPAAAPNKQTAEQWNVGLAEGSLANRGTGSVVMNGEPAAEAGGRVNIKGARAGVDGNYGIEEVEHVYSRSGGFITTLSLRFPELGPAEIIYGEQFDWVDKTPRQEAAT